MQFGNVLVLATVQAVIQTESKTKYHAGKLSKQVIHCAESSEAM